MDGGTDKHVSCCDKRVHKVAINVYLMPLYRQLMFCTCSLCLHLKESENIVFTYIFFAVHKRLTYLETKMEDADDGITYPSITTHRKKAEIQCVHI